MNKQIVYKLTDENGQTRNRTQWGPGVSHSGTGEGKLCGPGWIHYYDDPLLAVLMNPVHADFENPKLWEATAGGEVKSDNGLKFGCRTLTTIREIPLPEITVEQRVRFAILCAMEVCKLPEFAKWADNWLSGKDRSKESAWSAAESARSARAESESQRDLLLSIVRQMGAKQ